VGSDRWVFLSYVPKLIIGVNSLMKVYPVVQNLSVIYKCRSIAVFESHILILPELRMLLWFRFLKAPSAMIIHKYCKALINKTNLKWSRIHRCCKLWQEGGAPPTGVGGTSTFFAG
jgi:hypothetical protein